MTLNDALPYILAGLGGLLAGNILGFVTRGGAGIVGRTLFGVAGGLGALVLSHNAAQVQEFTASWSTLLDGERGQQLGDFLRGAAGGGIFGLLFGILIRPAR